MFLALGVIALGLVARRIAADWRQRYGLSPWLMETYVEATRSGGHASGPVAAVAPRNAVRGSAAPASATAPNPRVTNWRRVMERRFMI